MPLYGPYCALTLSTNASASSTFTKLMTAPPHPPPV
jgi:hypothetical protein